MKLIVFLSICLLFEKGSTESSWSPIVSPLLSSFPCKDNNDIVIWFEAGLQTKDNNRYYVYVNKYFPGDCKIRLVFNSEVKITFVVRTDTNEYSRMSMSEGDTYSLSFFVPHQGLGFIVQGTEPGMTPYLLGFSVNSVELCEQPTVGFLEQYASKTTESELAKRPCGRRIVEHREMIVQGEDTSPGQWPWHAAVYKLDKNTLNNKYQCGGTLLSNSFVITAAHCVTYRGNKLQRDVLSVVLGKYTLLGDDSESVVKSIHEIILPKKYTYQPLRHDIALLKLSTEVAFTDFIQPACLLRKSDRFRLQHQINTQFMYGTIVGWGFDKNDSLSRSLKQASMPIVSELNCLKSNPMFYSAALNDVYTFCAGSNDGTSACNGDSGGGFQVFIPDDTQSHSSNVSGTWHVKGIISNTLARFDKTVCDPDSYVIFTNVEEYIDWIEYYLAD